MSVSVDRVFEVGRVFGLPVFFIEKGEVYRVSVDEGGKIVIGDKLDYSDVGDLTREFSAEEKERMVGEVFENDPLFKIERLFPEARCLVVMSDDRVQFIEFLGEIDEEKRKKAKPFLWMN